MKSALIQIPNQKPNEYHLEGLLELCLHDSAAILEGDVLGPGAAHHLNVGFRDQFLNAGVTLVVIVYGCKVERMVQGMAVWNGLYVWWYEGPP